MDIHTAEPLVPNPSLVKVEIASEELTSIKRWVMIKYRPNCLKQDAKV
jgi:hypothetical protein